MVDLIPGAILDRYDQMLGHWHIQYMPDPGTEMWHLRWMIARMRNGYVTGEKAHRWLGFVQGVLIMHGYTTVAKEREFTRPFLNGDAE